MTMLNKNVLLKYFWAKAINTACYVLNHVLIRPYLSIKLPMRFEKIKKNSILTISKFSMQMFYIKYKRQSQ